MFDGRFLHMVNSSLTENQNLAKEIVNIENIGLHSYNEHSGIGYGEIYCYIPTSSQSKTSIIVNENKRVFITNDNDNLEGLSDSIGDYSKNYYYNEDFSLDLEYPINSPFVMSDKYGINAIVVFYDVKEYNSITNSWSIKSGYSNIPMGIYIPGRFENNTLTNSITKFISSDFGTGTSYGLRICTRFSSEPSGHVNSVIEANSDTSFEGIGQLMTKMSENISTMLDVVKSTQAASDKYKDILSIFRNNRTNVPYCKAINGEYYWFVNGRLVGSTNINTDIVDDVLDEISSIDDNSLHELLNENDFAIPSN